jgi:hypothetical protein
MKTKLASLVTLLVIATLALAACSAQSAVRDNDNKDQTVVTDGVMPELSVAAPPAVSLPFAAGGGDVANAPADYYGYDATGGTGQAAQEQPASGAAATDRLVIKNATLSIVVDNPTATVDAITKLAEGMGGFVVSLNTYKTTYGPQAQEAEQANMTIRVPSANLNAALEQIKGLAVEVNNESVSGQDVTSEYTDLKSRLTNLEAAERQLQSIMEEATKTEDVLAVYNQLVYTREQIEVIKGQMKYYEESAAMSAITLDIVPNIVSQPIEVGGWHPEGVVKQALEDTIRALQNFTDGLIYFAIARLPFLLLFGIPALLIGRWGWKQLQKTVVKPTTETKTNQ